MRLCVQPREILDPIINGTELDFTVQDTATLAYWEWVGYVCICGPVCFIGFVFNILCILVFYFGKTRLQLGSSTCLLQILAIADNFVLVMIFMSKTLEVASRWNANLQYYGEFFRRHLSGINGCFEIAKTYEVLLVAFITTTRFICMFWPLRFTKLRQTKSLLIMCFVIFIYTVVFCIPRFFEFTTETCWDVEQNKTVFYPQASSLLQNKYYHAVYLSIDCIVNIIIPIALVAVMNILVVYKLRKLRHQLNSNSKSKLQANNVAMYLLAVSVMFSILMLTSFVTTIMVLQDLSLMTNTVDVKAVIIADVMFTVNCFIDFLLYLLVGTSFRASLHELCCCLVRKSKNSGNSAFHNPMSITSTSDVLY